MSFNCLKSVYTSCLFAGMILISHISYAVTVEDSHGQFTIDYKPERVVALEYSFVDSLALIGISPVGIADDNYSSRILPDIQQKIGIWTSVGLRSQPSLEVIAGLKPDLIIADVDRHSGVYEDLNKIAPTLLLPSRRETYQASLDTAAVIGKVLGRDQEMQARLTQHREQMAGYRAQISAAGAQNKVVQFGVARESSFYAHSPDSYTGGVLSALGLQGSPLLKNENASRQVSLEQLIAINPDYLIVGDYVGNNIISDKWAEQPLWNLLKAVRDQRVFHVDGNIWARCRGVIAAEHITQDLLKALFISDVQ